MSEVRNPERAMPRQAVLQSHRDAVLKDAGVPSGPATVRGLGLELRVQGSGFRGWLQDAVFRFSGLRIWSLHFQVKGLGPGASVATLAWSIISMLITSGCKHPLLRLGSRVSHLTARG